MGLANLTDRQQELLMIALQHCLANPEGLKINIKAFKEHGGFATESSANSFWYKIKKRLLEGTAEAPAPASDDVPATDDIVANAATPKKRGRKAAGDGDGTPSKRAKKGAKKGASEVKVEAGEEAAVKHEGVEGGEGMADGAAEDCNAEGGVGGGEAEAGDEL